MSFSSIEGSAGHSSKGKEPMYPRSERDGYAERYERIGVISGSDHSSEEGSSSELTSDGFVDPFTFGRKELFKTCKRLDRLQTEGMRVDALLKLTRNELASKEKDLARKQSRLKKNRKHGERLSRSDRKQLRTEIKQLRTEIGETAETIEGLETQFRSLTLEVSHDWSQLARSNKVLEEFWKGEVCWAEKQVQPPCNDVLEALNHKVALKRIALAEAKDRHLVAKTRAFVSKTFLGESDGSILHWTLKPAEQKVAHCITDLTETRALCAHYEEMAEKSEQQRLSLLELIADIRLLVDRLNCRTHVKIDGDETDIADFLMSDAAKKEWVAVEDKQCRPWNLDTKVSVWLTNVTHRNAKYQRGTTGLLDKLKQVSTALKALKTRDRVAEDEGILKRIRKIRHAAKERMAEFKV